MPDPKKLRGLTFPFRIDPTTHAVAMTEGSDKLEENLRHLLLTRPGERLMLRGYGSGVYELLQEVINPGILAVLRHHIGRTILEFEPRAMPLDVRVTLLEGELHCQILFEAEGSLRPVATTFRLSLS